MKILEVILIASQLALVVCLPQDIRFGQPSRLQLGQLPAESVSLGLSTKDGQRQSVPFDFQRVLPETFFISDRNQNQFASSSPNVVTVTFADNESYPSVQFVQQTREGQDNPPNYKPQSQRPIQHSVGPDGSSGQRVGIVFDGAFQPRPDRVSNFERENEVVEQQHRYVVIPSRQTAQDRLELNDKQEQRLQNPELFIFRSPEQQRNEGYLCGDAIATTPCADGGPIQETLSGQLVSNHGSPAGSQRPLGIQNHIQTIDSTVLSHRYPISESLPLAVAKKRAPQIGSGDVPRSDATLVTRLTAPSNDPRTSNTLMITRRPCEICCVGNEVAPCKSCCAHTPLLNANTLKTVLG